MPGQNTNWDDVPVEIIEELEVLRDVPVPGRENWENGRAQFLSNAREMKPEGVSFVLDVRHKNWKERFQEIISQFLPTQKEFRMTSLITLLSTVAVVLSLGIGTVAAAPESLPGSPLYPLKHVWEVLNLKLANDQVERVDLALNHAQNRLQEVNILVQRGTDIPPALSLQYQNSLQYAFASSDNLPEPQRTRLLTQLQVRLQTQLMLIEQIMLQLHSQDRTQTRAQLNRMSQTVLALQEQMQKRLQTQTQNQPLMQNQIQDQNQTQTQNQNQTQTQNNVQTQNQSQSQNQTQNRNQNQTQVPNQIQLQSQSGNQNQNQSQTQNQNQTQNQSEDQNQTGKP